MTATRDRDSDLDSDTAEVEWDEHPIFGRGRGLPWWAAVLLALVLSAAGAVLDRSRLTDDERLTALGLYHVLFLLGCVGAVLAVRRRNLFGPMVQPPLIFAATFIPVQLTRTSTETGTKKLIFEVGLPLASSFPWMAGATAATIVLGVIRLFIQRDPARRLDVDDKDSPRRDRARDKDDRPARRPAREERPPREERAGRGGDERRPREERGSQRRDNPPPRRPAREDRPAPNERRERGNRSEAPARRNPPRPREQGGRPQQRRRPREDDYRD